MNGDFIGLVAVIMSLGVPLAAMYTYYSVRKLRTQERLAAIARGTDVPMVAELSESARSRRWGILLCSGAVGFIIAMGLIATIERERDTWTAAAVAIIPLAVGLGYFLDSTLIRRDANPAS
jgi:peptidoglycan/LPS O-acetylase OafA/YrhL